MSHLMLAPKKTTSIFLSSFLAVLVSGTALAAPPPMGAPAPKPGATTKTDAVLPPTGKGMLPDPFPSAIYGAPQTPKSSEKIDVSEKHIDAQVAKSVDDIDQRLAGVHLGDGNMKVEELPEVTLREDIASEARIHRLKSKKTEVAAAMDLWGAGYDGKREVMDDKSKSAPQAQQASNQAQPEISEEQKQINAIRQRQMEALEAQRNRQIQIEMERQRQEDILRQIQMRKKVMGNVPPVISSIFGLTSNPKATILIPYIGSRDVVKGDTLSLIDGTKMKILSIDDGVTVSHNGGASQPLSFGSSVPTRQDAIESLNEILNQGQSKNGGNVGTKTSFPASTAPRMTQPGGDMGVPHFEVPPPSQDKPDPAIFAPSNPSNGNAQSVDADGNPEPAPYPSVPVSAPTANHLKLSLPSIGGR